MIQYVTIFISINYVSVRNVILLLSLKDAIVCKKYILSCLRVILPFNKFLWERLNQLHENGYNFFNEFHFCPLILKRLIN